MLQEAEFRRRKAYGREPVRILLLEDDPGFVELLRMQLRTMPWVESRLEVAVTLSEALSKLAAENFGLVLTDLFLPDASGLEAVEALCRSGERLVIALTADRDPALRPGALEYGAYDFMCKADMTAAAFERLLRLASIQAHSYQLIDRLEGSMKSLKVLIALALFLLSFQAEGAAGKEKFDLEKREADRVATRNLQVWNRDQKYRQDSFAYGPFHLHGPIYVFDLAFDNMKICRTHIWGKSNHSHASPGSDLNETNTGIGYACRINENDTHRWWWAADTIRNSHRLPANFTGPIYQYPLFEVGGLKFLVGGQMAFMNYCNPVREGGDPSGRIVGQRSANLIMGVPGWTVEGTGRFKYLAFDWGRIPLADVTIMRFSLQARFLW